MADRYSHSDDGKLHTRYSELVQIAGDNGLERALEVRFGHRKKLDFKGSAFGKARHELLQEEGEVSNKVPEYFGIGDVPISFAEKGYAVELFPGVVVHFTADLVSKPAALVGDYKTCQEPEKGWSKRPTAYSLYRHSVQLDIYAYLLGVIGVPIKEKCYMVEYWNRLQTEILGHDYYRAPITLKEKGDARRWLIKSIERLMAGRQVYIDAGYSEVL